jgi:2'-5' RNA ligase
VGDADRYAQDEYDEWQPPAGIFVLAPIVGPAAAAIHQIQSQYDPKLAAASPPHITLAGSSGVGPIRAGTSIDELRRCLAPVTAATPVLELPFGAPQRFMQTDIISLPLDVHGPLRTLHDRIARAGLSFLPARFTFTPHVTLNLYRTLTPAAERELLALRVRELAMIESLLLTVTDESGPRQTLLTMPLTGR